MTQGRVFLIGAGCGDADLITLRGLSALRQCDTVVYDDLIDLELLTLAPPESQRIYMGKRHGKHSASQEEICQTLIDLARSGKQVARLKGGDPFVFGRGGEEILALQSAGIPFELIPGISSAIAIPAAAGIPVTHRGASRSFHVITGHTADTSHTLPPDLDKLAQLDGTLIFLMGLHQLPSIAKGLLAFGKAPDTPAAVLSGGNSPTPATVRGTLSNIAQLALDVQPPAVIVIGPVAALDLTPSAFGPLSGLQIGITGTAEIAQKQMSAFRCLGATPHWIVRSDVVELPFPFPLSTLADRPGWLVFTSANGVQTFFRQLRRQACDLRLLSHCKFAVIGPATGRALAEAGFYADLAPEQATSQSLALALQSAASPHEPIYLFRSAQGNPILPSLLSDSGHLVQDIAIYDVTSRATASRLPHLDYITFSSAGGVDAFLSLYPALPAQVKCVCIGSVTARTLTDRTGISPILSHDTSANGLIQAVLGAHTKA